MSRLHDTLGMQPPRAGSWRHMSHRSYSAERLGFGWTRAPKAIVESIRCGDWDMDDAGLAAMSRNRRLHT